MAFATTSISAIQARLRQLYGPDNYYTKKYSEEELSYFGFIPGWMTKLTLGDVLDVGPAYGTLACYASTMDYTKSVTTLDRTPYMINDVIDEFHLISLLGDIERDSPTLATSTYNTIIMTEVLEHLNFHPLRTLKAVHASLRPRGVLFLSTPDQDSWGKLENPYKELGDLPKYDETKVDVPWRDMHIWHYSETELKCLFNFIGLRVIQWGVSTSPGGKHFNVALYKA
jgi:SAM-dependent methyltransferase